VIPYGRIIRTQQQSSIPKSEEIGRETPLSAVTDYLAAISMRVTRAATVTGGGGTKCKIPNIKSFVKKWRELFYGFLSLRDLMFGTSFTNQFGLHVF
jgi:hypothetical protein